MRSAIKRKKVGYEYKYAMTLREVKDYFINEEQYFDYYQNSNDPTFELYKYNIVYEIVATDNISYFETGLHLLQQGKTLSLLIWQDFQNFIAEWLALKGWGVCQKDCLRNSSMNIITTKEISEIGPIKCIWVTKKHSSYRPVGVKAIRELDYLVSHNDASKGIIVTTSRLTRGALKLIKENSFRISYIDNEMLTKEFLYFEGNEIIEDLPF